MIDRTFLLPPEEDGQRYRAKILKIMEEDQAKLASNPEVVRFKCLVNGDYEEVIAYNKIVDYIKRDQTWDGSWHYRKILSHQGPLGSDHPKYKVRACHRIPKWISPMMVHMLRTPCHIYNIHDKLEVNNICGILF